MNALPQTNKSIFILTLILTCFVINIRVHASDIACEWMQELLPIPKMGQHAMATDFLRNKIILFGGDNIGTDYQSYTWEWDGSTWQIIKPATSSPPGWSSPAMVYHTLREQVILYSGSSGDWPERVMWTWDGTDWYEIEAIGSSFPSNRILYDMAYDSVRDRIVLFGGYFESETYDDLWEWDGVQWEEIEPLTSRPKKRYGHKMAFDVNSGKIIMQGGWNSEDWYFHETWLWDGEGWELMPQEGSPSGRGLHEMEFDPSIGKVLLYGGTNYAPYANQIDTWVWDGLGWTTTCTECAPPFRRSFGMAYDPVNNYMVAYGGKDYDSVNYIYLGDMWRYTGPDWEEQAFPTAPGARYGPQMAYDSHRDRIVLYGGGSSSAEDDIDYTDTWEWDGSSWHLMSENEPLLRSRYSHAMAYDSNRRCVVLFGGSSDGAILGDTWEWDGVEWMRVAAHNSEIDRGGHKMVYDSLRKKIIMFGGANVSKLNDAWEWDGVQWTELFPLTTYPQGRVNHHMAYDESRDRIVVFGGSDRENTILTDTWEWDGSDWHFIIPATTSPPQLYKPDMAYDAIRKKMVMFGGGRTINDTWEWDGIDWEKINLSTDLLDGQPRRVIHEKSVVDDFCCSLLIQCT